MEGTETHVVTETRRRRFTVAEYYQMAQAGILHEDDRVELVDGEVIEMTPIGRRHAACVARVATRLGESLRGHAVVWPQNPIRLGQHTEPQPDLALLAPRPDFYASGHPTPADVFLIIEVAETSVEFDRRVKAPLYARAGIAEMWLVDLEQQTVSVYRDPAPNGYRAVQVARRGEQVAPLAFPDRPLAVEDIVG